MPAAKRKSSPRASAPAAKRVKRDTVQSKVSVIVKHLSHMGGSASHRKILQTSVPLALKEYRENRHPHEQNILQCAGEALAGINAGLVAKVQDLQSIINNSESIKANHGCDIQQHTQALLNIGQAIDSCKQNVQDTKAALVVIRKAVAAAKKTENSSKKMMERAAEQLKDLSNVYEQHLQKVMAGQVKGGKAMKGHVKAIMAACKDLQCEESLLKVLPTALVTKQDKRGKFDEMAMGYVVDAFKKKCAELDREVQDRSHDVRTASNALQGVESQLQQVKEQADAADASLKKVVDQKATSQSCLKAAQKALSCHDATVRQSGLSLNKAIKEYEDFQETLQSFQELMNRSVPVPEPEAPQQSQEAPQQNQQDSEQW